EGAIFLKVENGPASDERIDDEDRRSHAPGTLERNSIKHALAPPRDLLARRLSEPHVFVMHLSQQARGLGGALAESVQLGERGKLRKGIAHRRALLRWALRLPRGFFATRGDVGAGLAIAPRLSRAALGASSLWRSAATSRRSSCRRW